MRRTRNCLWFDRDSSPNTSRYFIFNWPTVWCRKPSISCHIDAFSCGFGLPIFRSLLPLCGNLAQALESPSCLRQNSLMDALRGQESKAPVGGVLTVFGGSRRRGLQRLRESALSH